MYSPHTWHTVCREVWEGGQEGSGTGLQEPGDTGGQGMRCVRSAAVAGYQEQTVEEVLVGGESSGASSDKQQTARQAAAASCACGIRGVCKEQGGARSLQSPMPTSTAYLVYMPRALGVVRQRVVRVLCEAVGASPVGLDALVAEAAPAQGSGAAEGRPYLRRGYGRA